MNNAKKNSQTEKLSTPRAKDQSSPEITQEWQKIAQKFPEANFLQSPAWQEVNRLIGHQTIIEQTADSWCLMIVKNAKRGRYLEIPGGPLLDWKNSTEVEQMFQIIRRTAEKHRCVFVRLRPQLKKTASNLKLMRELGAKTAPMHLHAEHTIIIDLTQPEDQLLANMRRQTRYEVRRSAKLGLKVDWGNSEELFREFQLAQAQTALNQHFVPPDLKTLLAERTSFGENARLYVARTTDGTPVAYGLILISGLEAAYFEAASTDLNHKLPGAYALQWQVIRDLKALGIKRYNLWGIAPPGAKNHRYSGVTTFKSGFGGEVIEFVPAQDLILKHDRYLIDLAIEKVRKKVRKL